MEAALRRSSKTLIQVGEALGLRNIDPDPGTIFVTGGSGVIGHRVAVKLLDAGYHDIRLGTRHPEKLDEFKERGAQVADFAWNQEETYAKALQGVKSVLCTVPYQKDWDKHFEAFLKACQKAGVKHFVKFSFYHAREMPDQIAEIPLAQAHGCCDDMLVRTVTPVVTDGAAADVDVAVDFTHPNFSYTILYASHYMSNIFVFQNKYLRDSGTPGQFYGASHEHGVNYVSPNDIADVAVQVLLEPRQHYNKEYTLTGPEAIVDQQVAELIGKHLNKAVMYVDQPLHELSSEKKIGEHDWALHDLLAMEKLKASGLEEKSKFVSYDIEKILGRRPESFRDYLANKQMMTEVEK